MMEQQLGVGQKVDVITLLVHLFYAVMNVFSTYSFNKTPKSTSFRTKAHRAICIVQ